MLVLRKSAVAALAMSTALATGLVIAPVAHAVDTTSDVVISEVYGGGGNSGAPYNRDFIELYNKGAAAVDVSTWSVQYASATGTAWTNKPHSLAASPLVATF
jgi:predicted extracellular nuclease